VAVLLLRSIHLTTPLNVTWTVVPSCATTHTSQLTPPWTPVELGSGRARPHLTPRLTPQLRHCNAFPLLPLPPPITRAAAHGTTCTHYPHALLFPLLHRAPPRCCADARADARHLRAQRAATSAGRMRQNRRTPQIPRPRCRCMRYADFVRVAGPWGVRIYARAGAALPHNTALGPLRWVAPHPTYTPGCYLPFPDHSAARRVKSSATGWTGLKGGTGRCWLARLT